MSPADALLVLPLLLPLATAVAAFAARRWRLPQRAISILGGAVSLAAAGALLARVQAEGPVATQMGGWPPPLGISVAADLLAAGLAVLTALVGLCVAVYACGDVGAGRERDGFHPLLHVMLAGCQGAFLTGDLFNLYVWFEVLLVASFALMVLGGRPGQLDGGVKYLVLNMVATALLLAAIALLYGVTGTLNMADLHEAVPAAGRSGLMAAIGGLFLGAFALKAGLFPLFAWLPASYHTPPTAVAAVLAALLTKVGVYALLRLFTLVFAQAGHPHQTILLVLAALTMVAAVLGGAAAHDLRRLLTFTVVSQIGFMLMGLGLMTLSGIAGAVYYLFQDILVKAGLFLVAGLMQRRSGGASDFRWLGGLSAGAPWLAFLFLPPALALAGIPPFTGFWGKVGLIGAGIEAGAWAVTAVALASALVMVVLVARLFAVAFWRPAPAERGQDLGCAECDAALDGSGRAAFLVPPVAVLAGLLLLGGLWAEPALALARAAAGQLLDPAAYVAAVMGGRP